MRPAARAAHDGPPVTVDLDDPEVIRPRVCRRIRQRVGWTQSRVSSLTHLHQSTISRVECGKPRSLSRPAGVSWPGSASWRSASPSPLSTTSTHVAPWSGCPSANIEDGSSASCRSTMLEWALRIVTRALAPRGPPRGAPGAKRPAVLLL